jgi:hypothetical protein
MTGMRRAALAAITLLVAAASLTSFAESYRALLDWASRHGLHGGWAVAWPLQVDTSIAVGELALFVALADRWAARSRAAAWTVTLLGLTVSVAGNVGHVASPDWASRTTAAVPPMAAAAALAVGLGVLKRVVAARQPDSPARALAVRPAPAPGTALPMNGRVHPNAPAGRPRSRPAKRTRNVPPTVTDAESEFMLELAAGAVPSIRQFRARMHIGQDRARVLHKHLAALVSA